MRDLAPETGHLQTWHRLTRSRSDRFAFANGNNNITPGAPRAVRVALTTRF